MYVAQAASFVYFYKYKVLAGRGFGDDVERHVVSVIPCKTGTATLHRIMIDREIAEIHPDQFIQ